MQEVLIRSAPSLPNFDSPRALMWPSPSFPSSGCKQKAPAIISVRFKSLPACPTALRSNKLLVLRKHCELNLGCQPEVVNHRIYARASGPHSFNGLVGRYFLRNEPNQAETCNCSPPSSA